jgi:hypothetical protein
VALTLDITASLDGYIAEPNATLEHPHLRYRVVR